LQLTEQEEPLNLRELLAEYALGVLSEAEAASVRALLATDAEARDEYDEMAGVARLLPLAAEERSPGQHVRDGLMERVASEPRVISSARTEGSTPIRRWVLASAAAAILLVGGGAAAGYVASSDGPDAALRGQVARQAGVVEAAARGTLSITRGEEGNQKMVLAYAPGASDAFVYVQGLAAPPKGKAYQAWFTRDGKVFEPAEVFSTQDGGVWLHADGAVSSYAAAGFTIEDEGGAKTPSQAPFITLTLASAAKRP